MTTLLNERKATWGEPQENIGNYLSEVLENAKLNYHVEKVPLKAQVMDVKGSGFLDVPNLMATVDTTNNIVKGTVSEKYSVCQNEDAFAFIDSIDSEIKFIKAGETYLGLVYVIAALPEMKILGDDFTPYVIFQNAHNRLSGIRATISPLRMVCQNQFNLAFKGNTNNINIRHSGMMQTRMEEGQKVLANTAKYLKELNTQAEKFALMKINNVDMFIDKLFPITAEMSDLRGERIRDMRQRLLNAYNHDDNGNFRGSAWGLINAYSDFITHEQPLKKTENWEDLRFMRVSFDYGMTDNKLVTMNKFVDKVIQFAA